MKQSGKISRRIISVVVAAVATASLAPLAEGVAEASSSQWVVNDAIPIVYSGVACANPLDCWIVGSNAGSAIIEATVNGALSWFGQPAPSSAASLSAVSCPSAQVCVAGGASSSSNAVVITTANAGASWSTGSVPSGLSGIQSISCPSLSVCVAAARGTSPLIETTNSGASWTSLRAPASIAISYVSCPSMAQCVVAGNAATSSPSTTPSPAIAVTTNGGSSWTSASVPSSIASISGLSCASMSSCVVAGSYGSGLSASAVAIYSTSGGTSWSASPAMPQPSTGLPGSITAVACGSASACIASGNNMQYVTANGGTSWSAAASNPWGDAPLDAAACGSSVFCLSVGGDQTGPSAIVTRNGGQSWAFAMTGLTPGVGTVTCPTSSNCYALASSGGALVSSNGGTTWTYSALPSSVNGIDAVSCGTAYQCVGVGQTAAAGDQGEAIVTSNGAASWTTASVPTGYYSLQGVACPSVTLCVAIGGNFNLPNIAFPTGNGVALYSTNGGASWSTGTLPSSTGTLLGVSCSSTSFCMAVGASEKGGAAVLTSVNSGVSWASASAPAGTGNLSSVTCPSTVFCMAVGGTAIESTSNSGTSWSSQSGPSGDVWDFVTCASSTFCVVTGAQSSSPGSQPSGSTLATSSNGGSSWSSVSVPSSFKGLMGAHCPTASECFAVGFGGIISMGAGSGAGTTTTTTAAPASTTSTTVASGTTALTGKYLMTFSACNLATDPTNCSTPATEKSYLAQSSDGIHWTLASSLGSGEFAPFQASVPSVVTRGNEVYVYAMNVASNNQMEVVVYNAATGTQIKQASITLSGFTSIQYIDPDPVVTPSGSIVLFFTDSKPGCNSGTVSASSDCISSATEVAGSDGTRFTVDSGDRIVGPSGSGGTGFLSITDPEIFYDGIRWIGLVANHTTGSQGTLVYTSSTAQGTYTLAGTIDQLQTPPAGFYNPGSASYWLYLSSNGNTASVTIGRATTTSLTANLAASSFTTVASDSTFGLPGTDVLHASDAAINTATTVS